MALVAGDQDEAAPGEAPRRGLELLGALGDDRVGARAEGEADRKSVV